MNFNVPPLEKRPVGPLSESHVSTYNSGMARLPKGQTPTPHKDRMKIYRQELESSGGRRLNVDLPKEAVDAMNKIIKRKTPEISTAKDAIIHSLIRESMRKD